MARIDVGQTHLVVLARSDRGNDLTGVIRNCRVFIRDGTAHTRSAKPGEKWSVRLIEEFGLRRGLFVGILESKSDEPLTDRDLITAEEFDLTFLEDDENGLHGVHRGIICRLSRDWSGRYPAPGETMWVRMRAWAGDDQGFIYVVEA